MIPYSFALVLRGMLPKLSILARGSSAMVMIAALLFLTTANFWVYGIKKEKKQITAAAATSGEEEDTAPAVPNPEEEKNANTLQNLSEYLHDHFQPILHPVAIVSFGNMHDTIHFPIHHPDLLTPPPKPLC